MKYAFLNRIRSSAVGTALSVAFLPAILSAPLQAANISGAQMLDYTSYPVTTLENVTPKVMLTMSRDHQYFYKAYNDYTDLDGDGDIDTTYQHSFEYYGYFDPKKCYSYVQETPPGSRTRIQFFKPRAFTSNGYCDRVTGEWSGNFLNWASMTRMDIVRKIVFGGKRYIDNGRSTILERAHLPTDAHSFAKYYNGADVSRLTPFRVRTDRSNCTNPRSGPATCRNGVDNRNEGITICNTTFDTRGQSHTTRRPPLMRIVRGNFSLWATGAVFQCNFKEELVNSAHGNNANIPSITLIEADPNPPRKGSRRGPVFPPGDGLTTGFFGPDYQVRISSCVPGLIDRNDNNENCRLYDAGNNKPTGLLQEFGEDERIHFGLLTGSYTKNISGGVLRKNTGPIADEIEFGRGSRNDGTFKRSTGEGIIPTLNTLRIFGYAYSDRASARRYFSNPASPLPSTGRTRNPSSDDCRFGQTDLNGKEGFCASWGNPMAEIYGEAVRYFAGLQPRNEFAADDSDYIRGLSEATWQKPLNQDNFCAGLNIVMINSSLNSYDEETDFFSDIAGAPDPIDLTNRVGDTEGFHGNDFLIGRQGSKSIPGNDELCTPKTVTALGEVAGKCPEGPGLDGSYRMAGMAHFAKTNDIDNVLEGDQTVTTFAVQLATNTPQLEIDANPLRDSDGDRIRDNDVDIKILPAYRRLLNNGGGSLVDFRITQKQTRTGRFTWSGRAIVNWEDSEQGGDFDQDMWGTINYEVNIRRNTIKVETDIVDFKTNQGQLFGFIISGTTRDGFHAYSGGNGRDGLPGPEGRVRYNDAYTGDPLIADCNNDPFGGTRFVHNGKPFVTRAGFCEFADPPRSHTFRIGGSPAGELPDPLLLAAKYGGFDDSDDDDLPLIKGEYDTRDEDGNKKVGGDGIPDTYFFVTNPANLENSLRAVFDQVIERVASGTAAAVVASEQEGTGAVFQALYDPIKTDILGNEAKWMGTLHALFVDKNGFLREDTRDNDILDGYDKDKVIEIFYDENERRARLRRFDSSDADEFTPTGSTVSELETLNPIWNAREQLSAIPEANIVTQRTYSDKADLGRHILTWLDADYDGLVDPGEQVPFTTSSFTDLNYGWLDVWDGRNDIDDEADKLVDYIRGAEVAGFRSRTVDYDRDGSSEVMRLADVVNSTPTVMATPSEAFDILSLDKSYGKFRAQYRNRRNVVIVGANDGMIHAFNAGFFDGSASQFKESLTSEVQHPLGSELWAYIPKNLLGHLQWLADEDYSHVFFNDLKPFIFDAKIFDSSDSDHPGGWGTVLVVGMRLGGGTDDTGITLDVEHDGSAGSAADNDVMTKSAYVLLDITNPEEPPELIAEISPPNQYFTTSFPAVALVGQPDVNDTGTTTPNRWYLLFGSGPTDLATVESNRTARLFAYDLKDLVDGKHGVVETGPFNFDSDLTNGEGHADTGEANTFVGEITVSDQDLDMKAEAIYFGTVGGEDGVGGSLFRMSVAELPTPTSTSTQPPNTGWGAPFKLIDSNQPFSSRPSITIDEQFRTWVIAGTGRLFTNLDKDSLTEQSLYGFLDPNSLDDTSSVTASAKAPHASFVNTTNYRTFTQGFDTDGDGEIDGDVDTDGDGKPDTTIDDVEAAVEAAGGWVLDYNNDGSNPAERTVSNQTLIGGIVLSSAFTPTTDLCGAEGISRIIGRTFNSGIVPAEGIFETVACESCPDGVEEAIGDRNLGAGLASSPSIHLGQQDVPGKVTVIVQQSTGAITGNQAQTAGGLNNGEVSWQEFRTE